MDQIQDTPGAFNLEKEDESFAMDHFATLVPLNVAALRAGDAELNASSQQQTGLGCVLAAEDHDVDPSSYLQNKARTVRKASRTNR